MVAIRATGFSAAMAVWCVASSKAALPMLKLLPSLVDLDVGGLRRVDSGLWGLALSEENLARISELKQFRSLNLCGATLSGGIHGRGGLKSTLGASPNKGVSLSRRSKQT